MNNKEFRNYIESIGFVLDIGTLDCYSYKQYMIHSYYYYYHFHDGSGWWWNIQFNDLTRIETNFKNELRSIKLKQLLGCVKKNL